MTPSHDHTVPMKGAVPADLLDSIYQGDCLSLLKRLVDSSTDLIVSSPPYNIGKAYEQRQSLDRYLEDQAVILTECHRILKPTGSIFWQIGAYVDDRSEEHTSELQSRLHLVC